MPASSILLLESDLAAGASLKVTPVHYTVFRLGSLPVSSSDLSHS